MKLQYQNYKLLVKKSYIFYILFTKNSKEDNPNDHDIIEEDKNSKEVNKNGHAVTEEEKNSKETNLNEFDHLEKKKALIESRKFIGRDICKEFDGVKFFGTVTTYFTSLKLFEV